MKELVGGASFLGALMYKAGVKPDDCEIIITTKNDVDYYAIMQTIRSEQFERTFQIENLGREADTIHVAGTTLKIRKR